MGTAAQLGGEIPHLHHADLLAVLLAKQSHGAGLLRLVQTHLLGHYRQGFLDLPVHKLFHLCNLLRCHGGEMSEVKPESSSVHIGTSLLHVLAQYQT